MSLLNNKQSESRSKIYFYTKKIDTSRIDIKRKKWPASVKTLLDLVAPKATTKFLAISVSVAFEHKRRMLSVTVLGGVCFLKLVIAWLKPPVIALHLYCKVP